MSIFSMKPKEHRKVSKAELEKAKAELFAKKEKIVTRKEVTDKKHGVQGFKRDAAGILLAPHSTEKSIRASEMGTYVFKVSVKAGKPEIKKAVEKTYQVHVTGVRVINSVGKAVRLGRFEGRRSDTRKAMVTLKPGEVIQL